MSARSARASAIHPPLPLPGFRTSRDSDAKPPQNGVLLSTWSKQRTKQAEQFGVQAVRNLPQLKGYERDLVVSMSLLPNVSTTNIVHCIFRLKELSNDVISGRFQTGLLFLFSPETTPNGCTYHFQLMLQPCNISGCPKHSPWNGCG